jgi:hypothetical protein
LPHPEIININSRHKTLRPPKTRNTDNHPQSETVRDKPKGKLQILNLINISLVKIKISKDIIFLHIVTS